ncbi:MAG: hypothetical protein NZ942_04110 [Candidatus Aenigmarchaeota archaeon]|nr:hypothetical protein [Candidatus Aenigmarchaeota archaeon]
MKKTSKVQSVHRHTSGLFVFLPRLFKVNAQIEKGDRVKLTVKGKRLIIEKLEAKEGSNDS